jgi:hypothetical protein
MLHRVKNFISRPFGRAEKKHVKNDIMLITIGFKGIRSLGGGCLVIYSSIGVASLDTVTVPMKLKMTMSQLPQKGFGRREICINRPHYLHSSKPVANTTLRDTCTLCSNFLTIHEGGQFWPYQRCICAGESEMHIDDNSLKCYVASGKTWVANPRIHEEGLNM